MWRAVKARPAGPSPSAGCGLPAAARRRGAGGRVLHADTPTAIISRAAPPLHSQTAGLRDQFFPTRAPARAGAAHAHLRARARRMRVLVLRDAAGAAAYLAALADAGHAAVAAPVIAVEGVGGGVVEEVRAGVG